MIIGLIPRSLYQFCEPNDMFNQGVVVNDSSGCLFLSEVSTLCVARSWLAGQRLMSQRCWFMCLIDDNAANSLLIFDDRLPKNVAITDYSTPLKTYFLHMPTSELRSYIHVSEHFKKATDNVGWHAKNKGLVEVLLGRRYYKITLSNILAAELANI